MTETIKSKYARLVGELIARVPQEAQVSELNVYQEGIVSILPYIDTIIRDYLDDCSAIEGSENLEALYAHAQKGESTLILMEHYSNFDLPVFHYLLRKLDAHGDASGESIASSIAAIAGIKLNEENPAVHAFARAYTRIVIYPSRSLQIIKEKFKDPKELYQEMRRSISINHAAMKALEGAKRSGKMILVFPAGTRYRPWDPSSKRGVREIASYIKSFSKFCLVSVNGNILRLNPSGAMEDDILQKDRVIYSVSPVHDSREFLQSVRYDLHFGDDKKQAIVDTIMDLLDAMHKETENRCRG
jgi:glycerol-3-phosphate O-acyltransferase